MVSGKDGGPFFRDAVRLAQHLADRALRRPVRLGDRRAVLLPLDGDVAEEHLGEHTIIGRKHGIPNIPELSDVD